MFGDIKYRILYCMSREVLDKNRNKITYIVGVLLRKDSKNSKFEMLIFSNTTKKYK